MTVVEEGEMDRTAAGRAGTSIAEIGITEIDVTAISLTRNGWTREIWRQARALARRVFHASRRGPRRLRLCESLPLGERRFVAVVEFEQSRFLLGGTSTSLVLLARLEDGRPAVETASCAPPHSAFTSSASTSAPSATTGTGGRVELAL